MPSLTKIIYLRLASTSWSWSNISFPASNPAWQFVPEVIFFRIATSIWSNWLERSNHDDTLAILLKITIPTFTLASVLSICILSFSNISNAWSSTCALVDLSKTKTTSLSSFSLLEGRESVTFVWYFSSSGVAVLDFEISHWFSLASMGTLIKKILNIAVKKHNNFFIFSSFRFYPKKNSKEKMSIKWIMYIYLFLFLKIK